MPKIMKIYEYKKVTTQMSTKTNYLNIMEMMYAEQLPLQLEFVITANTMELQQQWSPSEH